jgi:hypothetical protein
MAWVAALCLALAATGCATTAGTASSRPSSTAASATLPATPTQAPVSAFTCAAGSLPVRSAGSQVTCAVSTVHGVSVLRAIYASSSTSGGSAPSADEYALTSAGWQLATEAHGDGAVTSQGFGVYLAASAYFAFE